MVKLDKLKETTQAANDNLNIIGNSRSTPKEKLQSSDPDMKHFKSTSQQNNFRFAPNIQASHKNRESITNQTRKSVIKTSENSDLNATFLIPKYSQTVFDLNIFHLIVIFFGRLILKGSAKLYIEVFK